MNSWYGSNHGTPFKLHLNDTEYPAASPTLLAVAATANTNDWSTFLLPTNVLSLYVDFHFCILFKSRSPSTLFLFCFYTGLIILNTNTKIYYP